MKPESSLYKIIMAAAGLLLLGGLGAYWPALVGADSEEPTLAPMGTIGDAITYQGYLTDENDVPLSGTFTMRFQIYNAQAGGTLLWDSGNTSIAVHDGLAMVSNETEVAVVDVREGHSFQNLGEIAFPAVEKIVVAPPDLWAGYAPSRGWKFLSLPRFLRSEDKSLVAGDSPKPCAKEESYRLNLFDDHVVRSVPGLVHLQVCQATQNTAGGSLGY